MSTLVQEFIEKARYASNIDELNALFETTIRSLGFAEWAYQLIPATDKEVQTPFVVTNYPDAWAEIYFGNNYSDIDPIVREGGKQTMPFQWTDMLKGVELTDKQTQFMNEATDFNLGDGIGIPILGHNGASATISMVSEYSSKELENDLIINQDPIHIISLVYHQLVKDIVDRTPLDDTIKLTNREKECLLWTAKGKTAWETSQILSISERTVVFHIENAKAKLGVNSRQHAVVKAVMKNIISI